MRLNEITYFNLDSGEILEIDAAPTVPEILAASNESFDWRYRFWLGLYWGFLAGLCAAALMVWMFGGRP